MPCRTPLEIEPRHCDFYGHVNNAAYSELLEAGRWDMIGREGFGPEKVRASGLGPVVLELRIRFKKELRSGEKVCVESWLASSRGKVFVVGQRILNAAGEEAALAEVSLGLFDLAARRLVAIPGDWKKAFGITVSQDVDKGPAAP